eukprot:scaffold24422_cov112-Isochrysis_galbana.AAC.5
MSCSSPCWLWAQSLAADTSVRQGRLCPRSSTHAMDSCALGVGAGAHLKAKSSALDTKKRTLRAMHLVEFCTSSRAAWAVAHHASIWR